LKNYELEIFNKNYTLIKQNFIIEWSQQSRLVVVRNSYKLDFVDIFFFK